MTNGSLGRLISRGAIISVCGPLRDRLRAAAKDFLWGLKGELVLGATGDVGDGKVELGLEAGLSEETERVLEPIGTVRFGVEVAGESTDLGCGIRLSGTSSAGGISRPRAAAMI